MSVALVFLILITVGLFVQILNLIKEEFRFPLNIILFVFCLILLFLNFR